MKLSKYIELASPIIEEDINAASDFAKKNGVRNEQVERILRIHKHFQVFLREIKERTEALEHAEEYYGGIVQNKSFKEHLEKL
tara:strand:+ start:749 stop:997 length:249 start_codon:yes stop_codon:yes gene_type:complete